MPDDLKSIVTEVVREVAKQNGNGHKWWGTYGSTVIWITSLVLTLFVTWHQMDKRISSVEDTMRRIELALGRVEDVVWDKAKVVR